jgi:hypothetical protein
MPSTVERRTSGIDRTSYTPTGARPDNEATFMTLSSLRRATAVAVAALVAAAAVAVALPERIDQPAVATQTAQRVGGTSTEPPTTPTTGPATTVTPTTVTPTTTTVPPATSWTKCADQYGGGCSYESKFTGVRQMRYGSPVTDQWVYGMFFGGLGPISCGGDAFGITTDPAPGREKECAFADTMALASLPAPTMTMGPAIDRNKIPVGHPGATSAMVVPGSVPADADDQVGAFRVQCAFSHMNFDDPIVSPRQPGASHLHTFFGNTATNANSTRESIVGSGRSTCFGGTANRSAYWVPSIIDTRTGLAQAPINAIFYYKSGYLSVPAGDIRAALPQGLRMIAGDARAQSAQGGYYGGWTCGAPATKAIPANCAPGSDLVLQLEFPQCWNEKDLDSTDHKSHMAYAIPGQGCPSTHPYPIPVITFNIHWRVPDAGATAAWRLSSDTYAGGPGGYSFHGDWWNGWDPSVEAIWLQSCVREARNCSDTLGNGRELSMPPTRVS